MKKRLLSLLAALALVFTLAMPAALAADEDTMLETVRVLGILSGDENGNLNLSASVTRAEFVKMMTAASTYKDSVGSSTASLFTDVKSGYWANGYIKLAVEQGWVTGYVDGSFRPDNTITLEEACTALLRLLGYDSGSLAGSFPDAQLSKSKSIGLLDDLNAVQGQALTRQDCVTLFYNLLTCQNSAGVVYGTTLGYTITNGEVDYSTPGSIPPASPVSPWTRRMCAITPWMRTATSTVSFSTRSPAIRWTMSMSPPPPAALWT